VAVDPVQLAEAEMRLACAVLRAKILRPQVAGRVGHLEQGTTKNDEGRKVKMTTEVYDLMLEATRGKNPDDFVFNRENGEHVVDPRDDWYALCVESKLGHYVTAKRANGEEYQRYVGLILHDFRRSALRNMTRRGVTETVALRVGGWKTASVARRYNITSESDLIEATRKIELGRQVSATDTKTDTTPVLGENAHSSKISLSALERMAGTTRLELATSAVTAQRCDVID
jgi:hypothetical protein